MNDILDKQLLEKSKGKYLEYGPETPSKDTCFELLKNELNCQVAIVVLLKGQKDVYDMCDIKSETSSYSLVQNTAIIDDQGKQEKYNDYHQVLLFHWSRIPYNVDIANKTQIDIVKESHHTVSLKPRFPYQ